MEGQDQKLQIDFQTLSCTTTSLNNDNTSTTEILQTFITQLFQLPRTSTLAHIPKSLQLQVPREKKLKQKTMTRWEEFSRKKGIKKQRRVNMVSTDEDPKGATRGYGYTPKTDNLDGWIEEVDTKESKADAKEKKKENVKRNEERRVRNLKEGQLMSQGLKKEEARGAVRKSSIGKATPHAAKREQVKEKLKITRTSTASMGKFDKKLEGDSVIRGRKKFDDNTRDVRVDMEVGEQVMKKVFKEDVKMNNRKAVMYAKK